MKIENAKRRDIVGKHLYIIKKKPELTGINNVERVFITNMYGDLWVEFKDEKNKVLPFNIEYFFQIYDVFDTEDEALLFVNDNFFEKINKMIEIIDTNLQRIKELKRY